jgi:type IV pilus assembly protein PilA
MKRNVPSRRDDGFTLIELLVVIIIIGVLAAIVIPSFLSQKDRAYRAAMKSDLRSVVTAQTARATDGLLPTDDVTALKDAGYQQTTGVTAPMVTSSGSGFVACVSHANLDEWLVYDTSTSTFTTDDEACAP